MADRRDVQCRSHIPYGFPTPENQPRTTPADAALDDRKPADSRDVPAPCRHQARSPGAMLAPTRPVTRAVLPVRPQHRWTIRTCSGKSVSECCTPDRVAAAKSRFMKVANLFG